MDSAKLTDPREYKKDCRKFDICYDWTRPDLCYAGTELSQHMSKSIKSHWIMDWKSGSVKKI